MKVALIQHPCGHRELLTAASDDVLRIVAAGGVLESNSIPETVAVTASIAAALLRDREKGVAS